MKTKLSLLMTLMLLSAVLLSGCLGRAPAVNRASAAAEPAAQKPTTAAVTPTARPTRQPTATALPTQDPILAQVEQAERAARAYFDAVAAGETEAAAELLSSFSLMVFQMTRGDAAGALQTQKIEGVRWSELEILGTQVFDSQTLLVQVRYNETGKKTAEAAAAPAADQAKPTPTPAGDQPEAGTPQEALWPMRLENGEWRYNWDNLIDFRTLDARAQTMNGVTIMPVQMNRYSDRVELSMLVQNRTNAAVVFGQVNETLGTFHFGGEAVVAEKTQWILNPLRSVPSATLEAKGLFSAYPDTITIRQWNDYDVAPWYVFQLQ